MTEQVHSASREGVSNNDTQNNKPSFFSIFGAIISLNLILWAGYWAYNLISRDINGIPIVAAQPGPSGLLRMSQVELKRKTLN